MSNVKKCFNEKLAWIQQQHKVLLVKMIFTALQKEEMKKRNGCLLGRSTPLCVELHAAIVIFGLYSI